MRSEDYMILSFRTDFNRIASLRVRNANLNVPNATVRDAMNNIRTANILDPSRGNLTHNYEAAAYSVTRYPVIT